MKNYCSTGKDFYYTEEQAFENLVDHLCRNNYAPGTGPINVYNCPICEGFHFTSKGAPHPSLSDKAIKQKIERSRLTNDW